MSLQLLSSEKINREVLRCIKLWDKFVFNRSTQKAERRYYDFKGNIIDKPDFGYGNKGNGSGGGDGDDNGSQSSGEAAATSSYGAGGKSKATPDTRPEFKVTLCCVTYQISACLQFLFVVLCFCALLSNNVLFILMSTAPLFLCS